MPPTSEAVRTAYSLFDAEPRGVWLTANVHTINTMKYYLGMFVRDGDEGALTRGVSHSYKLAQVPGIVARIKRIAASAQ
jgi:hypothetical protein